MENLMHIYFRFCGALGLLICLALPAKAWTFAEKLGLKAVRDYVQITVLFAPSLCEDPDFPILVQISNNYNETIALTRFTYFARKPERSSKIFGAASSPALDDTLIHPHRSSFRCWSVPDNSLHSTLRNLTNHPLNSVEWFGEILDVTVY
jgi:hypothetical protein